MTQRKPTPRRTTRTSTPRASRPRTVSSRGRSSTFASRTPRRRGESFNPLSSVRKPNFTRTAKGNASKTGTSRGTSRPNRKRKVGTPVVGDILGNVGKAAVGPLHSIGGSIGGAWSSAKDKAFAAGSRYAGSRRGKNGPKVRTAHTALDEQVRIPMPEGEQVLLTRRQLLYGAVGLGALAAVGAGVSIASGGSNGGGGEVETLEVPVDAVFSLENCTTLKKAPMTLANEFTLPYGTLVWANSDSYAACLLPTETSTPLTQVGILPLSSGDYSIVLDGPVSEGRGFDIYDVRCNDNGIVWTEANCFTGKWRVYQATHSGSSIGKPVLVEKGGSQYDVPFIAVAADRAFWQVMPNPNGEASAEDSLLKSAAFGSSEVRTDWTSTGRMSTPPYSTRDGIVITPRVDAEGVYHQLTLLDAATGKEQDSMTLPASMKPLEAGYVNGRFTFSFDAIYSYGDGIANLGTYAPVDQGGQSGTQWFHFDRNPSAAPAWAGNYFIVKSTRSIAGVDLATRETFTLTCPDGCDDYGDYLASTGTTNTIVSFLGMPDTDGDNAHTRVRVWTL